MYLGYVLSAALRSASQYTGCTWKLLFCVSLHSLFPSPPKPPLYPLYEFAHICFHQVVHHLNIAFVSLPLFRRQQNSLSIALSISLYVEKTINNVLIASPTELFGLI